MNIKIVQNCKSYNVNVEYYVKRVIRYAPSESIEGLNEIVLSDSHPHAFSSYSKDEKRIELFIGELIGWLPYFLKKSIIIPYIIIGLSLGHEIDHHVNRYNEQFDKEKSAETNALKYILPSFGIMKPVVKIALYLYQKAIGGSGSNLYS